METDMLLDDLILATQARPFNVMAECYRRQQMDKAHIEALRENEERDMLLRGIVKDREQLEAMNRISEQLKAQKKLEPDTTGIWAGGAYAYWNGTYTVTQPTVTWNYQSGSTTTIDPGTTWTVTTNTSTIGS